MKISLTEFLEENLCVLFVVGSSCYQRSELTEKAIKLVKRFVPSVLIFDISRNKHLRDEVQERSSWDFFPQLFLFQEFIGGYSILEEFFASGEYLRVVAENEGKIACGVVASLFRPPQTSKFWRMSSGSDGLDVVGAGAHGSIRVWRNIDNSPNFFEIKICDGWVNSVALSKSRGSVFAALTDGTIRVVNISSGFQSKQVTAHRRWVNDLILSRDELFLWSVSGDGLLTYWDSNNLTPIKSVLVSNECVWSVALSSCQKILVTGGADGVVKFWCAIKLDLIYEIRAHSSCVTSVLAVDNFFVSTSYDGSVAIFDSSLRLVRRFVEHTERVWTIAHIFGSICASASGDGTIQLWDTNTCISLDRLEFLTMPIAVAYWASEKKLLVSHDNGTVSSHDMSDIINSHYIEKSYESLSWNY
ncbi:hypothetical protein OX459_27300 [Janthinobacterium sp. SUN026]|uniref:hypothetical protein n=1 Tax=Janthinobacterium sp. SUN026 TaxID=3002438 RepID=UPI0025B27C43|nr:hypothetical protein [Janthinobacterium sp. SUN026]MDN2675112.1 hypothetical protein [Janthinobacterium sp. SUN026]